MLANVARHAEWILTVKTMSLTICSMHDSYHTSPEGIRRTGLGEEVRSLLRCRHVDQLYFLSGYLIANPVVLDIDVFGALMMHSIHGKLSSVCSSYVGTVSDHTGTSTASRNDYVECS